jgi:hypothetical protein
MYKRKTAMNPETNRTHFGLPKNGIFGKCAFGLALPSAVVWVMVVVEYLNPLASRLNSIYCTEYEYYPNGYIHASYPPRKVKGSLVVLPKSRCG